MNALEDLGAKFVDLDGTSDFIGKEALRKIRDRGVARQSVGLIFEQPVPRLEWFWDLSDADGRPGKVRWAIHSFALDRSLGIAVLDKAVKVGDTVTVTHPHGTVRAKVAQIPFVGKD
jgi:aminomethyltransferase